MPQISPLTSRIATALFWTAPAERSGDGAFVSRKSFPQKRSRACHRSQKPSLYICACPQDSLATRAGASSQRPRDLLCHGEHLSASASFCRQNPISRASPGSAQGRCGLRLAFGSLGGLFKSLSFCWPLSGEPGNSGKPVSDARPFARKDCQMDQPARPHARPESLAQLPGNPVNLRKVIFGPASLHAPKPG